MKYKNKMKRAATFLLTAVMAVTTMLGSTGLTAFAADATEPNPSRRRTGSASSP